MCLFFLAHPDFKETWGLESVRCKKLFGFLKSGLNSSAAITP